MRLAIFCSKLAVVILIVFSLPVTSAFIIGSLEKRFPTRSLDEIPNADVIVVLGGGLRVPDATRLRVELGPGADRLLAAHILWRANKAPFILASSGSSEKNLDEATLTGNILQSWGIRQDALINESNSINTSQNAERTAEILEKQGFNDVLLVTSATHMPRAVALFNSEGVTVIPVPADHWIDQKQLQIYDFIPHPTNLAGSSYALREYMGLIYYLLTDRISLIDVKAGLNV